MARRNPYYHGPVTDHFDGIRFLNPGEADTDRGLRDMLRWRRAAPDNPWPLQVEVVPVVPEQRVDALTVTMVGHATLLIQIAELNLLTDPVWSDRASPLQFAGPKRVTAPGVKLGDLPPIDAILLSHNHYDHLDVRTLREIDARHSPLIVTPLGTMRSSVATSPKRVSKPATGGMSSPSTGERMSTSSRHYTSRRADHAIGAWRCGAAL